MSLVITIINIIVFLGMRSFVTNVCYIVKHEDFLLCVVQPNCYSRVIPVNGEEHILIFAKRDIKQWEELTYDYRFSS